jgi:hypothetical protein
MHRRALLRGVGTALALGLGGCLGESPPGRTGPRNPPRSPEGGPPSDDGEGTLRLESYDYEETEAGTLRVFGEVVNGTGTGQEVTLVARVTTPDDSYERSRTVTVPPNDSFTFELEFDVEFATVERSGSVLVELDD